MEITVYHNPRCSKSRRALALLVENGIEPKIIDYINNPPDAETIRKLALTLGVPVREMLRTGEAEYRDLNLDDRQLSDDQLCAAMAAHPRLIQRPIAVRGTRARIGRPPETVLELL